MATAACSALSSLTLIKVCLKGIAHAVGLCEGFVGEEKFVYLGDNLLQHGIKSYVKRFERSNLNTMILLKEVENPTVFGVAELDKSRGSGNKKFLKLDVGDYSEVEV